MHNSMPGQLNQGDMEIHSELPYLLSEIVRAPLPQSNGLEMSSNTIVIFKRSLSDREMNLVTWQ